MTTTLEIYKQKYEQLVQLVRDDKDETPEAERLRDEMDTPWYTMSHDDREAFWEWWRNTPSVQINE